MVSSFRFPVVSNVHPIIINATSKSDIKFDPHLWRHLPRSPQAEWNFSNLVKRMQGTRPARDFLTIRALFWSLFEVKGPLLLEPPWLDRFPVLTER